MECQGCGSARATFHMTSIENNKRHEIHLCESCFVKSDLAAKMSAMALNHSNARRNPEPKEGKSKCGRCGMTLKKIHERGRVGCSDDYDLFSEEFSRLFREIHGSAQHSGKIPGKAAPPSMHDILLSDLERLKKELSEVIKSENYELAAELRDKIKGIENEMSKLGATDQSKEQS